VNSKPLRSRFEENRNNGNESSDGLFQVAPGSLFPALQRIEERGLASGTWGMSENNRRTKY
jgi:DNA-binding PadR family transcriptional regulator